ncbi:MULTISPECIES: hypothetical protein [unclassified Streptomyces]|uniref:hypothetical protein n=1 Tax=unclassified Streptomyces TaxID=2593676 RepID=UPI000F45CA72|nr:hypothetical protein [Streptomyces sp. I6]RNL73272.1 hypothetical protein EBF04_24615 [Streptomyces sp. I6]
MSIGALAILGVAAVMILALVMARPVRRTPPGRFRPGLGRPRLRPMSRSEADQYLARWSVISEQFVESPGEATTRARQLLDTVATARGLPTAPEELRTRALDTLFPGHAEAARRLREASEQAAAGNGDMETMRRAMLAGRALLAELVAAAPRVPDVAPVSRRRTVPGRRVPPPRSATLHP